MKLLILSGTAREDSNTLKIAKILEEEFQEKHETELFDLKEKEIPFLGNRTYEENEKPVPEDINDFSRKVEATNCLIIVSPEYNHSIPGALKTTLDYLWPEYEAKLFAYVGVSDENYGAVRALQDLEKITRILGGKCGPKLPIANVSDKVENKSISSEKLEQRLKNFQKAVEKFKQDPIKKSNPYLG